MRGVEATTWQLLIAARQVCSTVQGIHLSTDEDDNLRWRCYTSLQPKLFQSKYLFYELDKYKLRREEWKHPQTSAVQYVPEPVNHS